MWQIFIPPANVGSLGNYFAIDVTILFLAHSVESVLRLLGVKVVGRQTDVTFIQCNVPNWAC